MKSPMGSEIDRFELEKRLKWYEKRYGPYIGDGRGLKNIKNLFRKPNNYEWTILFMLIMSLFIAWAYQEDTAACMGALEDLDNICLDFQISQIAPTTTDYPDFNFTNIFAADNSSPNG